MIFALSLSLGVLFASIGVIWYVRRHAKREGVLETQVETYAHVLDKIKTANRARDSLNDPAVTKRLRDKYTRKG